MTVSLEQKVDFLLKKLGYSATKTGIAEDETLTGTVKAPFAEAIASPLVVPATSIWQESQLIPSTPPVSTSGVVQVSGTANAFQMTMDNTVSGKRTYLCREGAGNNSSDMVGNWIDTQFGADYIVNVYKGDPASGGVKLAASGSGSNDTWFFDYSAGVLNFNGSVVPSGVEEDNIYIVAYRYVGAFGVSEASVESSLATFGSDINLMTEKLISLDQRIEEFAGINTLILKLEDNTPTTPDAENGFMDRVADGSTTVFAVDVDTERNVYTLEGIPQPTITVPRGDIIEFDISNLANGTQFRIFKNGTEQTDGVHISADKVTLKTAEVATSTYKLFYKNTVTPGMGWIIEITDT